MLLTFVCLAAVADFCFSRSCRGNDGDDVTDFVILLPMTKTPTAVIPVSVRMPTMLEFIVFVAVVILTVTAARETELK